MVRRKHLAPEEREEYDALMAEAGLEEDGITPRPSGEIGKRVRWMLETALRNGQTWAGWVLTDDAEAGHLKHWNDWVKEYNKVRVITPSGLIVPKPAVVGVQRKDKKTGRIYYQQSFLKILSWPEVEQKLAEAERQSAAADINAATARRLLALRAAAPQSKSPGAACLMLGLDFEAYLAGEQNIAA